MVDPTEGVAARIIGCFQANPTRSDIAFALVVAALAVGGVLTVAPEAGQRDGDFWGATLAAAAHLPLIFRRRWPLAVLPVVAAATWLFWILDYPASFDGGILVGIYSVLAHEQRRARAWSTTATIVLGSIVLVIIGINDQDDVTIGTLLSVMTVFAVAAVLGEAMWNRRAYQRELEDKAARAQADAAAEADRAVAEERTRIARELHDVVAHSMSVMVVQAGAARRVLQADPERAEKALAAIEDTGRSSLTEMRRVLGILRSPDDERTLSPQPTLDDFSDLVASCSEAGVEVDLVIEGDERPLAAGLELAVFRIVQEALTNVVKHSAADRADVRLSYGSQTLEVAVYDAGRGAAATPAAPGTGNGLVGMRERVELFNGSLVTGPRPGGGYQVVATLPTTPPTTPRPARDEVPA